MSELSKFEKAVKNRANEIVQKKIGVFRKAVADAVQELNPSLAYSGFVANLRNGSPISRDSEPAQYIGLLISENPNKGWPLWLWEKAEAEVTAELMGLLDPVQRAMKAPEPGPDDCSPVQIEPQAHD